jgi:O-antigen ligase
MFQPAYSTVTFPDASTKHSLSFLVPILLLAAAVTVTVLVTSSLKAVFVVLALILFCSFILFAPPFWLALVLIVAIPFQSLISQLIRSWHFRELFTAWKEVLLVVGVFRTLRRNPNRRQIIVANRWVLLCGGLLLMAYCVTFVRSPSVPALFSIDFETRFLLVMLFFMFLNIDEKRTITLVRAIVWSVGLLALYGLVQYAWDYDRLLPLANYSVDLQAAELRRLYSYSLDVFDPAYGATIALLLLFAGASRWSVKRTLFLYVLIVPCLALTYARSAYLGLLSGLVFMCLHSRKYFKRVSILSLAAACLLCTLVVLRNTAVFQSSVAQRIYSIALHKDESSLEHKRRMATAVNLIIANPFGIGLGKYGTAEARFLQSVTETHYTENWILQVGVQNGIFGALAYIGLTGAILVTLLQSSPHVRSHAEPLHDAATGIFVAITVAALMIPVWDFFLSTVYACAVVGLALGTGAKSKYA